MVLIEFHDVGKGNVSQLNVKKRNLWLTAILILAVLFVGLQVIRDIFREEERRVRSDVRNAIKDAYPEEVKRLKAAYGLEPFESSAPSVPHAAPKATVVLIHGLDDPGKVWMNLAPALVKDGFSVLVFTYPNDQPVTESAVFFQQSLASRKLPERITIVAHSMGGLVSREMLTHPELAYADKVKRGELPRVRRLIMVGTPNHGSELARFRGFAEVRDLFSLMLKGEYHWLQGIVDGTGEAGIELLPGSEFLTALNSRPHPEDVHMMVIAGVMSDWQVNDIETLGRELDKKRHSEANSAITVMDRMLTSMTRQIGDGLVSVDAARLPGVPLKIVPGTHLSMIRNITISSKRIPPAVPMIVEELNRPRQVPSRWEHQQDRGATIKKNG